MLANKVKCVDFCCRVLKVELDTYKLRVKALQEENRALRQASVSIVSVHEVCHHTSFDLTSSWLRHDSLFTDIRHTQ